MEIRDEAEYRRKGWSEGVNVVLADGQAWALPRVLVRWAPAGDDAIEPYVKLGGAPGNARAYADLWKQYLNAGDADSDAIMRAAIGMARTLLLANYDLNPEEVAELIQFSWDKDADPEGCRIQQEVMDVALGRGPSLPKA